MQDAVRHISDVIGDRASGVGDSHVPEIATLHLSEDDSRHIESPDHGYEYFKREVLELTDIDLSRYKEKQMKRRINTLMDRKGVAGYESYASLLRESIAEKAHFVDYITINVTDFFRTTDHWEYFEQEALPELVLGKRQQLKIWSCACSTGEEPYSLVMSMAKFLPLEKIHVTATDIDENVLAQAERGVFSDKSLEHVPENLRSMYFTCCSDGWEISKKVRDCVQFKKMDLLKDEYPANQDLIICRNVLIYFTEEAKNEIYAKFYASLTDGGYLFTGNTEQIIYYKQLGFTKDRNFLYQK